ncbi:RNA-directed DNA polymerase, eukaryota, reverse transcriptase zinc-binding domain protein [Tanacetum coccineum]
MQTSSCCSANLGHSTSCALKSLFYDKSNIWLCLERDMVFGNLFIPKTLLNADEEALLRPCLISINRGLIQAIPIDDWFEAELEKCWKIQQNMDDSHSNLRRQARDDALRKWEAQIDQLRRQEHKVNLEANVNVMSESMLDELSLADPKYANIIVEMADKTRCVSQGIVENVLVKIDKFSFTSDFVIINTKELNNKTIILGRPFLANIRAEINISTREVSLGIKEDRAELSHGDVNKTHWCEPVRQEHENEYTLWASCDPYHEICDGGGIPDKKLKHHWKSTNDDDRINLEWEGLSCTNWVRARYDPEKCGETKERAIIGAIINKLPEEWFSKVSRDKDDLEGIIDYLEPILYDGFIDYNDKAYKQRKNKVRIMQISQENGQKPDKTEHETEKSARDRKECTKARDLIARRVKSQLQSTLGQPKSTH